MPGVVRQGDVTAGHSCFPPTPPADYSPNVTCNNKRVVREGDPIVPHCCVPPPPCHGGSYCPSHSVTVNERSITLRGDPVSCGDTTSACSPNVTCCDNGT